MWAWYCDGDVGNWQPLNWHLALKLLHFHKFKVVVRSSSPCADCQRSIRSISRRYKLLLNTAYKDTAVCRWVSISNVNVQIRNRPVGPDVDQRMIHRCQPHFLSIPSNSMGENRLWRLKEVVTIVKWVTKWQSVITVLTMGWDDLSKIRLTDQIKHWQSRKCPGCRYWSEVSL